MASPLSLLRQYYIDKKEIIERDDQIIFDDVSWPKNVKTNYLRSAGKKGGTTKEYYTLECLLFFVKNIDIVHPVYCQKAAAANIPAVFRPDRKKLLAYLNGETETSDSIDKNAPEEKPTQLKRTQTKTDDAEEESPVKKPRVEETLEEEVEELLDAALDGAKDKSTTTKK